ncbi:hypothetical protein CHS0354_036833 [Potamilus streckersoni]|uniref:Methyltransferase domain-containing protein n=1 Tax=Potamilus streckersoni TaxID=2493646 RepID=A0AAE0VN91_9BIVA|nr:hypothetical protein CHS0354_036833 [Potamilus streckersoni]
MHVYESFKKWKKTTACIFVVFVTAILFGLVLSSRSGKVKSTNDYFVQNELTHVKETYVKPISQAISAEPKQLSTLSKGGHINGRMNMEKHNGVSLSLNENANSDQSGGEKDEAAIPNESEMSNMSMPELENIFYKYLTSLQILCRRILRLGRIEHGGKEVCDDQQYRPKLPCLVYSFSIGYNSDFDEDVVKYYGCEVHAFDPKLRKTPNIPLNNNITFHNFGLDSFDGKINSTSLMGSKQRQVIDVKTYHSIKQILGHGSRIVDILKLDVEGHEWRALMHMAENGDLSNIRQLCIEFHGGYRRVTTQHKLNVLKTLHVAGFRIFMREKELFKECVYVSKEVPYMRTHCLEVSLVNIIIRE